MFSIGEIKHLISKSNYSNPQNNTYDCIAKKLQDALGTTEIFVCLLAKHVHREMKRD